MYVPKRFSVYLLFLHVKVLDDNAYEEIECEKRAKYDEEDKVEIHEHSNLSPRLHANLHQCIIIGISAGAGPVVKLLSHRWGTLFSDTGLYGPMFKVFHIGYFRAGIKMENR